jgi:Zn-dependent protease with chaperone function
MSKYVFPVGLFILFCMLSLVHKQANAMTIQDARVIYYKIIQANGIKHAPPLYQSYSQNDNASAGWVINVTSGMLKLTNEDEMALVLGHELYHWLNNHSSKPHTWQMEYDADSGGARLMSNAGFNRCVGVKVLLKLGRGGGDHPLSVDRYRRVKC